MRAVIINDIYALEPVTDSSLYVLLFLIISAFSVLFLFYKYISQKYKKNKNKKLISSINILKQNNFLLSLNTSYQISYYGKIIAQTNEEKELLSKINIKLEIYKYQEITTLISLEIQDLIDFLISKVESRYV
ncbi:MAG: hypothetical protein COB17_00990 [Sulfurimonas sp.]|nr:MAG: hypothetical protein COB17_00990 [Sulfurimonas sp.]